MDLRNISGPEAPMALASTSRLNSNILWNESVALPYFCRPRSVYGSESRRRFNHQMVLFMTSYNTEAS